MAVGKSAFAQFSHWTRVFLLALAVLGPASAQFSDTTFLGNLPVKP